MKVSFNNDVITNPETGERKQVVAKSTLPCDVKDLGLGLGLIAIGLGWLLAKTFRNGAWSYCDAEFNTLKDLDLVHVNDSGKPVFSDSSRGENA
ncbi:MAG: hypothetical protein J6Y02_01325 [Pseudobutyrivibrio sp.]|nr:hypothetical protein [Pseudobutyrivibrio sp.]